MTRIPRDIWPDATLPMLSDPYRYISRRARRLGTDSFRTRLLGRQAICLTGPEAAEFFYRPGLTERAGAAPERIAYVLFGEGGVQLLDGSFHRHRKALFLDLMSEPSLRRLDEAAARAWDDAMAELAAMEHIDLFREASRMLTVAVCSWSGLPLRQSEIAGTSDMVSSLFLHAGAAGPQHRTGVKNRGRATGWARGEIRRARHDRAAGRKDAVATIANWHDADGTALSADVAATELLNLIRPTVAVAVYATFIALALHRHPEYRATVAVDDALRHGFVQEVRRLYPFFPSVTARASGDIQWNGEEIGAGIRIVLDLYGTGRDPRSWDDPTAFRPERFVDWPGNPFTLIPQGGGDVATTHRCPGEGITIRLMDFFARRLATSRYDVATPDARPNLRGLPALPKGGFIVENFRPG
jgi:fatty-acid peroxygenase